MLQDAQGRVNTNEKVIQSIEEKLENNEENEHDIKK